MAPCSYIKATTNKNVEKCRYIYLPMSDRQVTIILEYGSTMLSIIIC
jgi:hypothetical protein